MTMDGLLLLTEYAALHAPPLDGMDAIPRDSQQGGRCSQIGGSQDELNSEILKGQSEASVGFGPWNQDFVDAVLIAVRTRDVALGKGLELHQRQVAPFPLPFSLTEQSLPHSGQWTRVPVG